MNDVLMLMLLALLLFCGLCLIQSIRRMAASDSRRIRRCRQAAAILVFDAVILLPAVRDGMMAIFRFFMEAKVLEAFRQTVFSRRNYQVQYLFLYYLTANLVILAAAWILLRVLEIFSDRGKTYTFRTLNTAGKLLHLPWGLAQLCYEDRKEGPVLKAWAAVLGKWMWNLSDAMLLLMVLQAAAAAVSLFVQISWLQGKTGASVFGGFYLLASVVWLASVQIGGFLEYCPKERPDRIRQKKQEPDEEQERLFSLLACGRSVLVTRAVKGEEWLYDYLYECFQKRRRVAVVCTDEAQAAAWTGKLKKEMARQYDRTCLARFGGIAEIQNQQDVDILIAVDRQLAKLEPDRVFPFWYQEAQTVILTDTHRSAAGTGGETDVFFALWNRKERPVQYVFLGCFGNGQEKQALDFLSCQDVAVFGKQQASNELMTWELDSPRGRMRRMLLGMLPENGVSEAWIKKQQEQFGVETTQTEPFLSCVLAAVFPDRKIQNLYDSFLFWEEPGEIKSSWRVRLTDPGIAERLKAALADRERQDGQQPVGMTDTPAVIFEDQVYRMHEIVPLASGMEQEKKRLLLYQARLTCETRGIFVYPQVGQMPDFSRESYYEKPTAQKEVREVTVLRLLLPLRAAFGEEEVLSALFSVVANQVLAGIFPYHSGEITAACTRKEEGRSIFCRVIPEEEYMPPVHCVAVDLIETQPWERGLTAVLRRNSREFFAACAAWLEHAEKEPFSAEGVLIGHAHKQLGRDPETYRGAEKLLQLLTCV